MEEENLIKPLNSKTVKKAIIALFIIVLFVTIIDQLTKFIAIKFNNIELIPNFLSFHIDENRNGTYGVSSNSTFSYVLTNLVVIFVLLKFILNQNEFVDSKLRFFLSLVIAGGFSNTIDRIFRGYVVEFIELKFLPNINIADIFIVIGWFSFVAIFASFSVKELKESKEKRKEREKLKDKISKKSNKKN